MGSISRLYGRIFCFGKFLALILSKFRETGRFSILKVESFGRKSFVYNGGVLCNELPYDIRHMKLYPVFKLATEFFIGKIDLQCMSFMSLQYHDAFHFHFK